jgi:DNA-binding transcriptional LysR family regulator
MLAMKANGDAGLLPEILRLYADQPAALAVEIMFGAGERAEMLRDGRADVGLLHWPQNDLTGLDFERLVTERLVVVLPTDHPLAGKDQVCLADLEGETLYRVGDSPVVYDGGQLLQMIALGRTVAVLPESVRGRLHSGLVTRPVPDAPPATVVVAWPQQSRSPAVAGFVRAAMEVAAMEVAATRPARSDPEPTA